MKRILITGKNSYIGKSFQTWLEKYPEEYEVESISVRGDKWKEKDFSKYDVVYHVAGIAHIKETKANHDLYYKVNRDLAIEVAKKSKNEGVKQFIFLSSMSVYGLEEGRITKDTPLRPKSAYGKSKAEAEKIINSLSDNKFIVTLVRPPMVYGYGCKGNYILLSRIAKKTFVFPNIKNKRSMIFIDNLSKYIQKVIDINGKGIICPQNNEYVSTSDMVVSIRKVYKKNIYQSSIINPVLNLLRGKISVVSKIFGDLYYVETDNIFIAEEISFYESIIKSEKVGIE